MKRAWTKKVKGLTSGTINKNALEGQLQPKPKVKVRIFRTSAAVIGLTVSIGTPNLLLTQAAPLPERIASSEAILERNFAAPETAQTSPTIAPSYSVTPAVVEVLPTYYSSAKLATKNVITWQKPQQPATVVRHSVPEQVPIQQPASQVETQATVVKRDVRAMLRQHQQAIAVDSTTTAPIAPTKPSSTQALTSIKPDFERSPAVESVSNPINTASSLSPLPSEKIVVNPEANSAWTAKQRLLIDRLKNQENPAPSSQETVQVPSNPSQPATVELPAPTVAATKIEQPLSAPATQVAEVPEAAATSDLEFEPKPLRTEVFALPTAQNNQNLASSNTEIAPPLPATEQSAQPLLPVFVLPVPVAQEQVAKAVDEQQVLSQETLEVNEQKLAAQDLTQEVEAESESTSAKEVPSVNEPIIVSSTTSEYQVKPGDTLSTIASEHRVSLPEIANFNNLPNPDLLLVDQKIKLPTLTSMKAQPNVAVLPPIEKVIEPRAAEIANLSEPVLPLETKVTLVANAQKLRVRSPMPVYNGVGGSVSEAEAEVKPLEKTALSQLQVQYAQQLQNDVQKLQQKYYAQNSINPIVPVRAVKGDRIPTEVATNTSLGVKEPVNPEFRVAQTSQDLKSLPQKQTTNTVKYPAPTAIIRGKVATAPAPAGADNEETFQRRQVTPELPPLAPALNYLPQPNGVPFDGYIWPAKGALTSKYGWRWGRMHRGIDIAAPVGTPIFASASGVVIKSGWNKGGYGNLVDIQHADGTLTRYAHNYRLLVQPGQFVE